MSVRNQPKIYEVKTLYSGQGVGRCVRSKVSSFESSIEDSRPALLGKGLGCRLAPGLAQVGVLEYRHYVWATAQEKKRQKSQFVFCWNTVIMSGRLQEEGGTRKRNRSRGRRRVQFLALSRFRSLARSHSRARQQTCCRRRGKKL